MHMNSLQTGSRLWLLLLLGVFALTMWTCKYPSGPQNQNTTPDTRIANVPANDDTARYIGRNAFPEVQLQWVGNDQDGYVVAFQYRWVSTRPGQPFPAPGNWTTVLNLTNPDWDNMILVKGS
ncbi:MAG: hypothetical protein HW412_1761, partial [Bacteroidetes bacterium]|nr:hypothetical protein [Bacteroidota bacterium]